MIHSAQVAIGDLKLTVPVAVETVIRGPQVTPSLNQGVQPAMLMQRMLEGNAWHILKLMQNGTLLQRLAVVGIPRVKSTLSASFDLILHDSSHDFPPFVKRNLDFTFLKGPLKMSVQSKKM